MKLRFSYLGLVMLFCIALLESCNKIKKPKTNWNVSLKREGKNPYDTYIAFNSLKYYFPDATIKPIFNNYDFTQINKSNYYASEGQCLLVLVGRSIDFSKKEWDELLDFINHGNKMLILSSIVSQQVQEQFSYHSFAGNEMMPLSKYNKGSDNLNALTLQSSPSTRYGYWGRDFKGYFELDSTSDSSSFTASGIILDHKPTILGQVILAKDSIKRPNFISYQYGKGSIILIATPLVFSNYFLLQDSNKAYLDEIWKSVSGEINQIYWGGYTSRMPNESTFSILWRNVATRLALIIVIITALVYLLFQIKRRQRVIPIIQEPTNTSVAFIETVGMLYYNKGDNNNIAHKMDQHFMEWLRNRFHLNTNVLNETFMEQLSMKTGIEVSEVKQLLQLIHELRLGSLSVSDEFLFELYKRMQQFYKTK